jgi:hypothetical protein
MLPLILPCSLSSLTWTWIASIDIIDVFHLSLPCRHSYHHILYTLRVDVQWTLHIPLYRLTSNPFDVVVWHVFLLFPSWCLSFLSRGGEKGHQKIHVHLRQYMGGNWDTL